MTAGVASARDRIDGLSPRPWESLTHAQVQLLVRLATFLALATARPTGGCWITLSQWASAKAASARKVANRTSSWTWA